MEINKYILIICLSAFISSCYETENEKPFLSLTTDTLTISEANNTILLEVWMSERVQEDVMVNVDISGNAVPEVDYLSIADYLQFPAGHISRIIPIKTIDNSLIDKTRFIELSLSVDEANAQLIDIHEDMTYRIDIIDNEIMILLSLEETNSIPVRMILKKKYNDIVVYEIDSTGPFSSTDSLGIDGRLSDSRFEVFLKPETTINKLESLDYHLSFSDHESELTEIGTCIFSDQTEVKILSFTKTFNGIEMLDND